MTNEFYFRYGPIELALFVFVPAAVFFAIWLYRRQSVLSPGRRIALTVLRSMVYAILILMLFAPVFATSKKVVIPNSILVLMDVSESMSTKDHRESAEELTEAAAALGKVPVDAADQQLPNDVQAEASKVSRIDLAKGVIRLPELDVLRSPGDNSRVACYTFGDKIEPSKGEGVRTSSWLDEAKPTAQSTRLGDSLLEVVNKHGGQSITGVLILSDGSSNGGVDPVDVARELGERNIPVYTIGLGVTEPDDVRIQTVFVPDTVFFEDEVPVRVLLHSQGFNGREVEVALTLDGKPVASKSVTLAGGTQSERFSFVPDQKVDTTKLSISASCPAGDINPSNNSVDRSLRVIDDKIKVLYVERAPRWEYRYLRGILTRDHRLDVKFLLTEGDPELAKASDEYIEKFPDKASEAFRYDLVILGDVPADYFEADQLERIEELILEHGGSLLMLAGRNNAPMSYRETPIETLLPVKIGRGSFEKVEPTVFPVPTEKGLESLLVRLAPTEEKTRATWERVKPLYSLPGLDGVKAGAEDNVLVFLSNIAKDEEPYPLVVWQRYGTGKSLFVATDQLWRLRKEHGDEYHARFWKQTIQFLTLSRLLGENKRIRLATDRKLYREGDRVQVYANVLDESFKPVESPSYIVMIRSPDRDQATPLALEAIPGSPGLFQGFYTPERAGDYHLKSVLADEKFSNIASFAATDANREQIKPEMQEQTLRKISELSGGRYLEMSDLPQLEELLKAEPRTASVTQEASLWDRWYVFAFVLGCLATEWFVRRRNDVA